MPYKGFKTLSEAFTALSNQLGLTQIVREIIKYMLEYKVLRVVSPLPRLAMNVSF